MVLKVAIAEDNLLVREGIASVLAMSPDIELVASCTNVDELLAAVDEFAPGVVVTDIRMPPTQTDEGIRAANALKETHPSVGVVVLSQYIEPSYAMRLFESGSESRAYLLKERVGDADELASAIRTVAGGGSVIDPKVVDALISARSNERKSIISRLTERETEVLAEMAKGGSNTAIGEALFISSRSVEKHINSIFSKLDLVPEPDTNRRVMAVLMYLSEAE